MTFSKICGSAVSDKFIVSFLFFFIGFFPLFVSISSGIDQFISCILGGVCLPEVTFSAFARIP